MFSPHHRHQSSLEDVIDFSTKPPLETDQRNRVQDRFYSIVNHFHANENNSDRPPYKRSQLVRFTYEYARSQESKDTFLRAFFETIRLSIDNDEDIDFEQTEELFFTFADYLLDHFFLPCKPP